MRVLKLCGLGAPPPKMTYRTSNGVLVEYTGSKLTLSEYLDFSDAYVDDTGLQVLRLPSLCLSLSLSLCLSLSLSLSRLIRFHQKFMTLFKILPGKLEERHDVINALKVDPKEGYKAGDLVYLISER
jgi:hypothetical protein